MSAGRERRLCAIAACTSWAAASMSRSSAKVRTIVVEPWLELDSDQPLFPALGQRRHFGGDRVEVVAVFVLERAALAKGSGEFDDAGRVALAVGIDVQRHRHARRYFSGMAERGEAAEHDVVGFARELSRLCEQPTQVVPPHAAAGSSAKLQGEFCSSASVQSLCSRRRKATVRTGPSRRARQREM